ncbi:hypothetical protein ABZP36_025736 [Zizania latifolia]
MFLALDKDTNGTLSKHELKEYADGTLTDIFIERVFDEHVRRNKVGGGNSREMDFESFLDFVLALENKDTPEGLTYLFRCLDLNGRGFLTTADIHTLFSGSKWTISSLPSCDSISSVETVSANQAMSCFFKIKEEAENSFCRSDMVLSHESSTEEFDVSQSPITDFHNQERYQQGKLAKVVIIPSQNQTFNYFLIMHAIAVHSTSPVWRFIEGPRTVTHDFLKSYYEANIQ